MSNDEPDFGAPPRRYAIIVADNFHYQDKDEEYEIEGTDTLEEAIAKCREIVDACLKHIAKPGMNAETIYWHYVSFGEDPYIIGPGEGPPFSAWTYAKARAGDFVC